MTDEEVIEYFVQAAIAAGLAQALEWWMKK
jgi:hypothetical protein